MESGKKTHQKFIKNSNKTHCFFPAQNLSPVEFVNPPNITPPGCYIWSPQGGCYMLYLGGLSYKVFTLLVVVSLMGETQAKHLRSALAIIVDLEVADKMQSNPGPVWGLFFSRECRIALTGSRQWSAASGVSRALAGWVHSASYQPRPRNSVRSRVSSSGSFRAPRRTTAPNCLGFRFRAAHVSVSTTISKSIGLPNSPSNGPVMLVCHVPRG